MSARRSSICTLAIILFTSLLTSVVVFARAGEPLEALISRAETAPSGERPGLYAEIAERELRAADQLYNTGQADAARAAVDKVVTYSEKACDATSQARGKIKNTEIAIRKMAAKLRDIKRSLAFEEQQPVQNAADHLEKLRSGLLARIFGKDH